MTNNGHDSPEDRGRDLGSCRLICAHLCLVALFVLVAVASFLPDRRLWGVNHLAFYGLPVRFTFLSLMALSFHPGIASRVYRLLLTFLSLLRREGKSFIWISIIVAALSFIIFVRFSSSTLLLGDGTLVANNFEHAQDQMGTVARDLPTILSSEPIAKGATCLYFFAGNLYERVLGGSPVRGIGIVNCMLGSILVVVLLRFLLAREVDPNVVFWLSFLVLASGTVQVFFGYVENYTPMMFLAMLYLASSFLLIRQEKSNWLVLAMTCLILAVLAHIQAILLVPSALFLLVWFVRLRDKPASLRYLTIAVICLTAAAAFAVRTWTGYGQHYLTLGSTAEAYGLLTLSHLADIGNELLLLHPLLPTIAVMTIVCLLSAANLPRSQGMVCESESKGTTSVDTDSSGDRLSTPVTRHFAITLLVPTTAFLVIFKPDLGMPRDWDLFAIVYWGWLPFSLLAVEGFFTSRTVVQMARITVPALVISALLAGAWVGVNASPDRSVYRFKQILRYDKTRHDYAYEVLATHHRRQDRLDKAITTLEQVVPHIDNTRLHRLLADYYEEDGRLDEALKLLRWSLDRHPRDEPLRRNLVILLPKTGRYDEALEVARDGTRYHPKEPIYHYYYGAILVLKGQRDEGLKELLECKRLNPPKSVLKEIESVMEQLQAE